MYMQIVELPSGPSHDEVVAMARAQMPSFGQVAGLQQKYYCRREDGAYVGVYVFESEEARETYRGSELASSLPAVSNTGLEVMFTLR